MKKKKERRQVSKKWGNEIGVTTCPYLYDFKRVLE